MESFDLTVFLSPSASSDKAPHFSRLGDEEVNAGQNATFQCVAAGRAAEAEKFLLEVSGLMVEFKAKGACVSDLDAVWVCCIFNLQNGRQCKRKTGLVHFILKWVNPLYFRDISGHGQIRRQWPPGCRHAEAPSNLFVVLLHLFVVFCWVVPDASGKSLSRTLHSKSQCATELSISIAAFKVLP